jgi:hypothetical protein
MAKYSGTVGYVNRAETTPGVWSDVTIPRIMRGDVLRAASVTQGAEKFHGDVTLQHRISVIGDAFAFQHFFNIKWLEYAGVKWQVTLIDIQKPRIILTLGGRWNG